MANYHKTLGISPGASPDDIKRAYRKLALKHHPDKGGDEEQFKKITEAYEYLSGKRNGRLDYDERPFDFPEGFQHFMYGFGPRQQPRPPSTDAEVGLQFSLNIEQIRQGKTHNFQYTKSEDCVDCKGVGGESKNKCLDCNGFGVRQRTERRSNGAVMSIVGCKNCNGFGFEIVKPCNTCNSLGFVTKQYMLKFEVKEIK